MPDPANPQDLNRYSYTRNNPLRYIDPSGYFSEDEIINAFGVSTWGDVLELFEEGGELEGLWGWLEVLRKAELDYFVAFLAEGGPDVPPLFSGFFFLNDLTGRISISTQAYDHTEYYDLYTC